MGGALDAYLSRPRAVDAREFVPLARSQVSGLALLGPCCDRAKGQVASAHGDSAGAISALERALAGFEVLKARTEADVTRKALDLESLRRARSAGGSGR
jgi:hypothetical protein